MTGIGGSIVHNRHREITDCKQHYQKPSLLAEANLLRYMILSIP